MAALTFMNVVFNGSVFIQGLFAEHVNLLLLVACGLLMDHIDERMLLNAVVWLLYRFTFRAFVNYLPFEVIIQIIPNSVC